MDEPNLLVLITLPHRVGRFFQSKPFLELRSMASESVHEFTDDNFDAEVLKSDAPVLVDFWAPWCGPCRQIAPMIDELAEENPKVKIGKVNIDDNPGVAQKFGIQGIPTLLLMKDGEVTETFVGVRPKASLQEAIDTVG